VKILVNWHRRKAEFRYPIEPVPRTAVLVPWFDPTWFDPTWFDPTWFSAKGSVRAFENGWSEETAQFAPEAIAATWTQLKELAADSLSPAVPPAPTHALVVLHRTGAAPLAPDDREWLWRKFGVPIFEQVIGARGELIAAECEAHDGMHLETPEIDLNGTSLPGQVDVSPCACGRQTPRLRSAPSPPQAPSTPSLERLRAVAAYAR
jgi:hypothetical protein